jgi:hypothetical protein
MRKAVLLLGFALLGLSSMNGQNLTRCSTMENLERLKQENPALEERMRDIESFTEKYIDNSSRNRSAAVVTIPVVVHVVYNSSTQNISDAQILSQIDVLNEDFRRLNADRTNTPTAFQSRAADVQVNFCLASRNPSGGTTTGIIRKQTSTLAFTTNDDVKYTSRGGSDAWPTGQYLNIWVCNLGGGVLGYAQFPGGPASSDGVVVLYRAFGRTGTLQAPYNKGRTATHEVGHWLNLYHIWGDVLCGNDQVSDTPQQQSANYGCPSYPSSSCLNASDMFMNYMDYTDDACMNLFTQGQSTRMNALFASGGFRASLLTSQGCGGSTPPPTCTNPDNLAASSITSSSATLTWASTGATGYTVRYRPTGTTTWTIVSSNTNSKAISGLAASTTYEFQVQSSCSPTTSWSIIASFTTLPASGGGTGATLTLGSGTSTTGTAPYGTYYMDERVQLIFTRNELLAAGYTSANSFVRSLSFNVSSASSQVMNSFTIRLAHTSTAAFASGGLLGSVSFLSGNNTTTVFSGNVTATAGWNKHTFSTAFQYNGTDNLLVDICWNNSSYTSNSNVFYTSTPDYQVLYLQSDNSSGSVCANTSGTRSLNRPNVRLEMTGTAARLIQGDDRAQPSFTLVPNPVSSAFTIRMNAAQPVEEARIQLIDIMGRVVWQHSLGRQEAGEREFLFNIGTEGLPDLENGTYICLFSMDGQLSTSRIVVQK